MFFTRKKSVKESEKSREEAAERAGRPSKKGSSEATVKIESRLGNASLHKSTTSSARVVSFEEDREVSKAALTPECVAESQRLESPHSEHTANPAAQAASTSAAFCSRAATPSPVTLAVSTVGEEGEEDEAGVSTAPRSTKRPSTSPTQGRSLPAAEGMTHSRVTSGQSVIAGESLVFSVSDSPGGTSIRFATDSASPEHVMSGEADQGSHTPRGVEKNKSGKMAAQTSPEEHDDADHHTAAVSGLTSQSSLDVHVEDDELARDAPTEVAAAGVGCEARRSEGHPSQSPKMKMTGSSKPVSSGYKRETLDKSAEIADNSARRPKCPTVSVDCPLKENRTHSVLKGAAPSQARPMRAPKDGARASHASTHKTKELDGEQRWPPASRGRDSMNSAPLFFRSRSGGSVYHREPEDSAGEESARRLRRRECHRRQWLRSIPASKDFDEWSGHSTDKASESGASGHHEWDVTVDTGGRRCTNHARCGKANGQSRQTDPDPSQADRYSGRELSGMQHRRFSSQRPVRCRDSQQVSLANLDGGALVRQCLMEVMVDGREIPRTCHQPRHRRRSGEAVQQRALMKHICHGEEEYYSPLHSSVSSASSVSPVERQRKDDDDDDSNTTRDESRARSHRCRSNGSTLHHSWHFYVDREASQAPTLYADPVLSHRISFDDDTDHDRYAASALTRSEELHAPSDRLPICRSRAGKGDRHRSASGRSRRVAVSNISSDVDADYEDELRQSPPSNDVRRSRRLHRGDAGLSPWTKERRRSSGQRQLVGEQERPKHPYEGHRTSQLRGSGRMHSRRDSELDSDHYYSSGFPQKRYPSDLDDYGGFSHSRSCPTPRAAVPTACDSPRCSCRGIHCQNVNAGVQPGKVPCRSFASSASSPVRGRRTGRAASTKEATPLRRPSRNRTSSVGSAPISEKELLDEVEWKLDVLEQQIADEDAERERAMMRSPFERLYHLNNRRDRDERRKKVFQLNRLERIRDQIISGSLEEALVRKEERRRKQHEMLTSPNGVFMRLYHSSSPRRSSADVTCAAADSGDKSAREGDGGSGASVNASADPAAVSGQSVLTTRSRMSVAELQALGKRLHERAVATQRKREEMTKQSLEERQQRQAEELLIARLTWQIQLDRARSRGSASRRPQTPAQLEDEARAELKKLREEDPEGYEKKVLRGRVLSEAERDMNAMRLSKHGYMSRAKLEAQKKVMELKKCTFHPIINEFPGCAEAAVHDEAHGKDRNQHSSGGTDDEEPANTGAHRGRPHPEANRFAILYRKGIQAKERSETLREQRDREARLKILRSRMASDHHFRRRVELDPSLADRFMKSLVV